MKTTLYEVHWSFWNYEGYHGSFYDNRKEVFSSEEEAREFLKILSNCINLKVAAEYIRKKYDLYGTSIKIDSLHKVDREILKF